MEAVRGGLEHRLARAVFTGAQDVTSASELSCLHFVTYFRCGGPGGVLCGNRVFVHASLLACQCLAVRGCRDVFDRFKAVLSQKDCQRPVQALRFMVCVTHSCHPPRLSYHFCDSTIVIIRPPPLYPLNRHFQGKDSASADVSAEDDCRGPSQGGSSPPVRDPSPTGADRADSRLCCGTTDCFQWAALL